MIIGGNVEIVNTGIVAAANIEKQQQSATAIILQVTDMNRPQITAARYFCQIQHAGQCKMKKSAMKSFKTDV